MSRVTLSQRAREIESERQRAIKAAEMARQAAEAMVIEFLEELAAKQNLEQPGLWLFKKKGEKIPVHRLTPNYSYSGHRRQRMYSGHRVI